MEAHAPWSHTISSHRSPVDGLCPEPPHPVEAPRNVKTEAPIASNLITFMSVSSLKMGKR